MGFFCGMDDLTATQTSASKGTQGSNPNQWPDLILYFIHHWTPVPVLTSAQQCLRWATVWPQ